MKYVYFMTQCTLIVIAGLFNNEIFFNSMVHVRFRDIKYHGKTMYNKT